jgi:tetratricopeptide (TPR) repeat protein
MQMRSTLCRLFPWLTVLALAGAPTVAAADDLDSCARQSGDAAIAACSRAIASGEFSGEELAKIYLNRGVEHKNKSDLDSAMADDDEAIRLNPKFAKSYCSRGVAREKKRSLQEALSDFEAYAQLVPSDPDGPKSMARVKSELSAMTGRR